MTNRKTTRKHTEQTKLVTVATSTKPSLEVKMTTLGIEENLDYFAEKQRNCQVLIKVTKGYLLTRKSKNVVQILTPACSKNKHLGLF